MQDITILRGGEIAEILAGKEKDILALVREAYILHGQGRSNLPHSVFLRFPDEPANRIIALPAFLGGRFQAAGMKWISSFPGNVRHGMERASAALILNSTETGHITSILESSVISAKRTAASAALGAQALFRGSAPDRLGLIGCGPINFEILRFLAVVFPSLRSLALCDRNPERTERFRAKILAEIGEFEVMVPEDNASLLRECDLVSFATTAGVPHIQDLERERPSVILHVSLRDLSPRLILAADNIVDDCDHVCRAQTSVHLAEQTAGNREFIRAELWEILSGKKPAREPGKCAIFSPFGLGILDIAVGNYVYEKAMESNEGSTIQSFVPQPWFERT